MDTTTKINDNRLLLLKELLELRDIVIKINKSEGLLNYELKNLKYSKQKYINGKNELLQNKNYSAKGNLALNFIKSEDFKRLCIATYCNLCNSFSYTLCQYENHGGIWCVTSTEQETFDDNNSIMNYIQALTDKYHFEILDFINTIGEEKYESFSLDHFTIDELSKSLKEKVQDCYRSQLSNIVEDYNEEMKMQVTFRPEVPFESCSAYRKKQVDLVEEVNKLKDELKGKLEKLIYTIPEQFIKEENLTKIQSCYLTKFQKIVKGEESNFKEININMDNKSLADMKKKVINKYCTFLPPKYIFNEYALNYFVQYIYYEQANNIDQCINIFEHRKLQENVTEQTASLGHAIDNLEASVVDQLSKINMKLDTFEI